MQQSTLHHLAWHWFERWQNFDIITISTESKYDFFLAFGLSNSIFKNLDNEVCNTSININLPYELACSEQDASQPGPVRFFFNNLTILWCYLLVILQLSRQHNPLFGNIAIIIIIDPWFWSDVSTAHVLLSSYGKPWSGLQFELEPELTFLNLDSGTG